MDGRFRFDNFVVGASNRLAVSAARAVSNSPGTVYNPLVFYSASGLGKTHLLGALGRAVGEAHPGLQVRYVTLEDVVDQLHVAVAAGEADSLTRRYQDIDVLLLDDVQFLTGHAETQSEILRLLNVLQQRGGQIVMACDRAPAEIADLDQRLLTRLAGGLVVDIDVPEYETRLAILQRKCAEREMVFPPTVLEALADIPVRNIRELQGALNRLVAQQSVSDSDQVIGGVSSAVASTPIPAVAPPDEFESFLNEIAEALSQSVEPWRARLSEIIARWAGEGFRVDSLERTLRGPEAPDVDALEATFAAAAARLRILEAEAVRLDAQLAELPAFRDPDRLAEAEEVVQRTLVAHEPPPGPDPQLVMASLAVGERNQLALRGATEVVEQPGTRYNPLYVYGASGSGKTHLLHAIGGALEGGGRIVACLSAGRFTDELVQAMRDESLDRWRLRYRAVDVFILDDVQALSRKERSQDELFHLFNALHDRGRQIVLAADVPPSHLADVVPRLRSRFDGGLVVEIGRVPEAERVARHTPVPDGAEAAAPTIDAWFDEQVTPPPAPFIAAPDSLGTIDTFFLDPEKCLIEWPDIEGRVIEDPR